MYKDVKKSLDNHGIQFYVHFGSALGAIRHNGFIPWDNDIDIAVWDEDIPRINHILKEELDSSKYYYHIPSADTHPHVIAKCSNLEEGLKTKEAPFIDLFPICRYPSTKTGSAFYWLFTWGNVGSIWVIDHISSLVLHKILKNIPLFFNKLAKLTVNENSNLTTIVSTEFINYVFPREYYGKPIVHVFEDTEVPLPSKTHDILAQMFGDYMTPPPEDRRSGASGFPCSVYKDYILYDKKK